MSTCERESSLDALELPVEFEDLGGLLQADLQAIVVMLTERAHQRLFLTKREHRALQARLWNGLTGVIQEALEPLQVECR